MIKAVLVSTYKTRPRGGREWSRNGPMGEMLEVRQVVQEDGPRVGKRLQGKKREEGTDDAAGHKPSWIPRNAVVLLSTLRASPPIKTAMLGSDASELTRRAEPV